ncbi:MAG: hypothetical protein PHQ35_09120 [Phycisphaerae bacterium]|nr:hypothetical protein [Phycisphaerae bacterium]MDD5381800.1 hypothetical protein [Phycisphaerae bacterium]
MSTQAKILANRLNSQKSTGPRSIEGKTAVSQNAVKHGLRAESDVITSESEADFDLYRQQLLDELNPISPMESILAERIVTLSWRLKRAGRFQNQAIDCLHSDQTNDPLKKLTQSLIFKTLNQPQPTPSDSDNRLALGRLAVKDFSNERVLDHLLMYERRIEHSLFKTILEFQRLNIARKLKDEGL